MAFDPTRQDATDRGYPWPREETSNDVPVDMQALAERSSYLPGVSPLSAAARDGLAGPVELWDGRIIWNTTLVRLERYDLAAGVWRQASATDHGGLEGLGDDDHPFYLNIPRHDSVARHGAGVVDHGSIGGLADDDHPQYINLFRGDQRYSQTLQGPRSVRPPAGVPRRLFYASDSDALFYDTGQKWVKANVATNTLEFTTSDTWVAPEGVPLVDFVVVGGGGAGGKGNLSTGIGGGSGYALSGSVAVAPGQSYAVVVGAGGPRGTVPLGTGITPGGDGGASRFAAYLALGGEGGSKGPDTNGGGHGGSNGGGSYDSSGNYVGADGQAFGGGTNPYAPGGGGRSPGGKAGTRTAGGQGSTSAFNGESAAANSGGGGGAAQGGTPGNGGSGYVRLTWNG